MKKRDHNFFNYWGARRLKGKLSFLLQIGFILFCCFSIFIFFKDLFFVNEPEKFSIPYFIKLVVSNLVGAFIGTIVMWYMNELKFKKLKKINESNS